MNTALKALQLKARHQVYTLLSGYNLSHLHGEGYDFSELREYQIGDDIRKINWAITAKFGTPYVKEFHSNRELSIVVSTFMDGSLYFASGNAKQKKLTEVASILGYACEQNHDLFRGFAYTEKETYTTPHTKQLYHIETFSKILYQVELLETTLKIQTSLTHLFTHLLKPSLLFLIGDFLEEVDLSLLAQKHEVIVIIIRDTQEEHPKALSEAILANPRNKKTLKTYFEKKNISIYLQNLKEHDQKLFEHFSHHNVRYLKISTDDNAIERLITLFV